MDEGTLIGSNISVALISEVDHFKKYAFGLQRVIPVLDISCPHKSRY